MSKLSLLLKNIVGVLSLNEGDRQRLHAEIDGLVPAAIGVALGQDARETVHSVVAPLLQDVLNLSEQRLMNYVERRLAGQSADLAIPPPLVVPAGVDPSLVSTAPASLDVEEVGAIVVGNEDAVSIPDASAPHVPDTAPAVVEEAPAVVEEAPANVVYDSPPPATEPQQVEAPAAEVVAEPVPAAEAAPAVVEAAPVAAEVVADTAPPSLGDQHNGGDAESFEPAPASLDVVDDDPKWRAMGYAFDPMTGEPL